MVEIVIEDDDERRIEGELLVVRAGAFETQLDIGFGSAEGYCSRIFFGALGGPLIVNGSAIEA